LKLSTRSRYGTRLIFELALKFGKGPIYLKDISKSGDISLKYLGQLIIPLRAAGIVKSSRGARGGYYLARNPKSIKLSEIINILEGPINIVGCIQKPDTCNKNKSCTARFFWKKINDIFYKSLEDITMQDMLDRYNHLNS